MHQNPDTSDVLNPSLFFTREQTCAALKIGKNQFYKLIKTGQLKARRHSNMTVVLLTDLECYLNNLPVIDTYQNIASSRS